MAIFQYGALMPFKLLTDSPGWCYLLSLVGAADVGRAGGVTLVLGFTGETGAEADRLW